MHKWLQQLPQVFCTSIVLLVGVSSGFAQEAADWKLSPGAASISFQIRGTGDRSNPLRRSVEFDSLRDDYYVQFHLRYDATSLDDPANGDGEFFVLWFDEHEGTNQSTHSGGIPNAGIHVADGENRFMVRFSPAAGESFAAQTLAGDTDYRIIVRLSRSSPSKGEDRGTLGRLAMWINPRVVQFDQPDVEIETTSIVSDVKWMGFSTGRKTEAGDVIHVSDIRLGHSWEEIFGLPQPAPQIATASPQLEGSDLPDFAATVDFKTEVLPILWSRCFKCHSGTDSTSGIRLDLVDEVLNAVTPGDAARSRLIEVVSTNDSDVRMPPADDSDPLAAAEVKLLEAWVNEGLRWDEKELPTPVPETSHWAFRKIVRPEVPQVVNSSWVRTPVDAFVAARQEAAGISSAPLAAWEKLRRRLWLDLVGLSGVQSVTEDLPSNSNRDFASDSHVHSLADALVDKLLASEQYGERWGRHWLDVARWAESNGHQHNRDRPYAWRYRDYVIRSFNQNKPFDQFVREQISGDEQPYSSEAVIATGFLAAARYSGNELDKAIQRNDILVDVVNTTTQAFLGLTVECAQCHSHKFDPITIRDYYRLQAFFTNGQPSNIVLLEQNESASRLIDWRWRMFDETHDQLVNNRRAQNYPEPILVIPKSVVGAMKGTQRATFRQIEEEIGRLPQAWGWYSPASSTPELLVAPHEMRWPLQRDMSQVAALKTYLRPRGDVKSAGPEVEPGIPSVFGSAKDVSRDKPRSELAEWLVSSDNPLTARVWVNRIWQWHFGAGLVATSGDFGTQGTPPTHPELLDWLAAELVSSGWNTNHIHRLILQSNAYRQSNQSIERARAGLDPDNKLLWRWPQRRLEAETLRDVIMEVAGVLDTSTGGPSVPLDQHRNSRRRSLYLQQKRDDLPEFQNLFDGANAVTSCSLRRTSTVPLQSLYLMNSSFMERMAEEYAGRIETLPINERLSAAFRDATGRAPDAEELQQLERLEQESGLTSTCLVLLNLNEFAYIP